MYFPPKKNGINVVRLVATILDIIQPFNMCDNKSIKNHINLDNLAITELYL